MNLLGGIVADLVFTLALCWVLKGTPTEVLIVYLAFRVLRKLERPRTRKRIAK